MSEPMRSAQLFRRPTAAGAAPHGGGSPTSPYSVAAAPSTRERWARIVVGGLSTLDWVRSQALLWAVVFGGLLAEWAPLGESTFTLTSAFCLSAVSFGLAGASFPDLSRSAISLCTRPLAVVLFCTLVVFPVIAVLALSVARMAGGCERGTSNSICTGVGTALLLPVSTVRAPVLTRDALGNEGLAKYLSTSAGLVSVYFSPLLMRSFLHADVRRARKVAMGKALTLSLEVISFFVVGVVAQRAAAALLQRKYSAHESDTAPPLPLSKGTPPVVEVTRSEMYERDMQRWRLWATRLNCMLVFVVDYAIFSAVARSNDFALRGRQNAAPSSLSQGNSTATPSAGAQSLLSVSMRSIVTIGMAESLLFVLACATAWALSGVVTATPEDRIAVFFSTCLKSDILVPSVFLIVAGARDSFTGVLLTWSVHVVVQAIGGSVLTTWLRRWRNSVNCRPGTTLLPQRISQSPRGGAYE